MKKQHLTDAVFFLRRVVVHGEDQDRLLAVVDALEHEIQRRTREARSPAPRSD